MNNELTKRVLSSIILILIIPFFIIKSLELFILFLIIIFFISFYEWLKMTKKYYLIFFGFIFLIFSFYSAYLIRIEDLNFFLFVLLICISTDIGEFVFGKFFKGPKLTKISPNKTYSGMLGSFFLVIITSYLFISNFNLSFMRYVDFDKDMILVLIALFISLISQIGDLIISYFKRNSKVKDTGKILPGHGGLLDRIDGMVFAFPFCYLIIKIFLIKFL